MKKNIILVFILALVAQLSYAQTANTGPEPKVKRVFPGFTFGANYTSHWSPELSLLLGMTNRSDKATKINSMLMHGPTLGVQLSKFDNAQRIIPRLSYEYYSNFWGGRLCLTDYFNRNIHSIYISPEAGFSGGGFLNLFFGVNLPVSENKIAEVRTFRFSATVDLLFFYFGKDKSQKK